MMAPLAELCLIKAKVMSDKSICRTRSDPMVLLPPISAPKTIALTYARTRLVGCCGRPASARRPASAHACVPASDFAPICWTLVTLAKSPQPIPRDRRPSRHAPGDSVGLAVTSRTINCIYIAHHQGRFTWDEFRKHSTRATLARWAQTQGVACGLRT